MRLQELQNTISAEYIKIKESGISPIEVKYRMLKFVEELANKYHINMKYEKRQKTQTTSTSTQTTTTTSTTTPTTTSTTSTTTTTTIETSTNLDKYQFVLAATFDVGRIILSAHKGKSDYAEELTFICNGLIINTETWKIVCVPSQNLNIQPNLNQFYKSHNKQSATELLGNFYQIYDGTVITLYYYDNKWNLGTTNDFDVSDYTWFSASTYKQLLYEIFEKKAVDINSLNTSRCYTIGFSHPQQHPNCADINLWGVISFDITTLTTIALPNEFPPQQIVDFSHLNNDPKEILNEIQNRNLTSYTAYKNKGEKHFGYIFRGEFDKYGSLSNFIMESKLMTTIRQSMYNLPKNIQLDNKTRIPYNVLKACLHIYHADKFLVLFPQYKSMMDEFQSIMSDISKNVIITLGKKNKAKIYTPSNSHDTAINSIVGLVIKDLQKNEIARYDTKTVMDYITNEQYLMSILNIYMAKTHR